MARDFHRRGARIERKPPGRWRRWLRRAWLPDTRLALAGIPLTPLDETKHCKLIGTTGTGKSTAIRTLLAAALQRGDRAIISDPDGGYLSRLYRRHRADVVLNPFERESVQWSPYEEIHSTYDIEQLASALIPNSDDASTREWRAYARTFLAAIVKRCHRRGHTDLSEGGCSPWRRMKSFAPW